MPQNRISYLDKTAIGGRFYYRLRQVGQAGAIHYSPVQLQTCPAQGRMTVYPNPAHQKLRITLRGFEQKPQQVLHLVNVLGQTVYQQPVLTAALDLDLKQAAIGQGTYFLLFTQEGRIVAVGKIVVN